MATQLAPEPQTALATLPPEAQRFELLQRQARMFASSPLVPEHLRKGSATEALANCYIALTLAEAMGEVPLVVMQNIHIVKGKAGFAAQYMIARANASGIFAGRIDWRIDKSDPNNLAITAFAILKDTGQEVSVTCDMNMARAEQWVQNPKYKSMPEVMLRYRSAVFLVRFYAPDVMLGYRASEEIEDVGFATGPDLSATPLTASMLTNQAAGGVGAEDRPASEQVVEAEAEEVAYNPDTGEVIDQPGDGTLDDDNPAAMEGPTDGQRGEAAPPEADYHGPQPVTAVAGQSWWDGEKMHYAHQAGRGIKWYLKPPQPAAEQGQGAKEQQPQPKGLVAELTAKIAAAQSPAEIDEVQELFSDSKSVLSEPEIKQVREAIATRRNDLA